MSPDTTALFRKALTRLVDRTEADTGHLTDEGFLEQVERLKDRYIPGFNEQAWPFFKARFREKAFLGVLETVAMVTGAIPRDDGGIRNPAAYLAGIFNKFRDGEPVQPEVTLATWLEIEVRRETEHAARARRAGDDRIKERNEALQERLRETLRRLEAGTPEPERASQWVGALRIDRWEEERVVFRAPTAFIRNGARRTQKLLTHACAQMNGTATFVSII